MTNTELAQTKRKTKELKEEATEIWESLSGYFDREEIKRIAHFMIRLVKGE